MVTWNGQPTQADLQRLLDDHRVHGRAGPGAPYAYHRLPPRHSPHENIQPNGPKTTRE